MYKQLRLWLLIMLLIFAPGSPVNAQAKKLRVVTTTTILLDIARNVAGDKVDLSSLVPTDGDAHEFEASPDDIRRIADADLVLINGVGLEGFIEELIKDSGTKATVVTVTEGIGIRRFAEDQSPDETAGEANMPPGIIGFVGGYTCGESQTSACDPHMWQDPTNVILYTLNIRNALSAADAANAAAYTANAALYVAKLQQLDADMWQGLSAIPPENRVLVTNHDALGYFAARYRFQVLGVVLPGGGTTVEPSPKEVADLVNVIKDRKVPAIFTENMSNAKLADEIARQTGVKIVQGLYTDALGGAGTPGETYLGMMRANLKMIVDALGAPR